MRNINLKTFCFIQRLQRSRRGEYFQSSLTAVTRFITLRNLSNESFSLAYQSYGEVQDTKVKIIEPVLVIHGMIGSKRNWHSFCKSYSELSKRQVIAVDCRNHGESRRSIHMTYPLMVFDVIETMKKLKLPKCILIGHSMGGKVAMEMAMSMPSMVEKLVVVDITPQRSSNNLTSISMVPLVLRTMLELDLMQVTSRKMADDMLKKSIPSFPLRAWVLTNLYKDENGYFQWYPNIHSIHNNHDSLLGCININGRKPYIGETLFIGGENSDILRNTDVKDLKHFFPNVDIKMIPGAGHFVHADKPKEFLETVLKFTK